MSAKQPTPPPKNQIKPPPPPAPPPKKIAIKGTAEFVASLVERLETQAGILEPRNGGPSRPEGTTEVLNAILIATKTLLREAASRLSSPEGTRGSFSDQAAALAGRLLSDDPSSPSSAPAATPAPDEIAMGLLQEVIDKSEPRKPGGQQVGTQRYQMTPSTRQELQRIVRHWREASVSAAERPAQTWQPIESAPERQKVIVSWVNALGNRRSTFAAFYPAGTLELDEAPDDMLNEDGTNAEDGWFEWREAGDAVGWHLNEKLTHWMPLPAPPGPVAQEKE